MKLKQKKKVKDNEHQENMATIAKKMVNINGEMTIEKQVLKKTTKKKKSTEKKPAAKKKTTVKKATKKKTK